MTDSQEPEKNLHHNWLRAAGLLALVLAILLPLLVGTAPSFLQKLIAGQVVSRTIPGKTIESWDQLQIEEKAKHSQAILIAEYRVDGEKLRAIVTKVLKERPGASVTYKVGNEYEPVSVVRKPNASHGDGAVVFIYGSDAQMHESYEVYGSSVMGLDNMPMSRLIELVANNS